MPNFKVDDANHSTFTTMNDLLAAKDQKLEVIVVGGVLGNVVLGDANFRFTSDTDIVSTFRLDSVLDIMRESGVHLASIIEVPPPEEMTIAHTLGFSHLKVHFPTVEDLAIMKLMSPRGVDFEDLEQYPILDRCDISKLYTMVEDYKGDILSDHPDYNYKRLDELLSIRGLS